MYVTIMKSRSDGLYMTIKPDLRNHNNNNAKAAVYVNSQEIAEQ